MPKSPASARWKNSALRLLPLLALAAASIPVSAQTTELKPGLYAFFDTTYGIITAELYEKYVPKAVNTFVGLATGTRPWLDPVTHQPVRRPLYDGVIFHRIVREMAIQAGDPTGKGTHNCGFTNVDEFLPGLMFDRPGRLAVANIGRPNTGACQFFITTQAVPAWNNAYTIFGQVVQGQSVVNRINKVRTENERPLDPITIRRVVIRRIPKPPKDRKDK